MFEHPIARQSRAWREKGNFFLWKFLNFIISKEKTNKFLFKPLIFLGLIRKVNDLFYNSVKYFPIIKVWKLWNNDFFRKFEFSYSASQ